MRTVLFAAVAAAVAVTASAAPKKPPATPKPAAPAAPGPSDWRTPDPNDVLVIDTNKGRILVEMVPEVAPQHVARMRELAHENFYDGLRFFRVIDKFMDQTGDPQNSGEGDSDLPNLAPQFSFARTPKTPFTQINRAGGFFGAAEALTATDAATAANRTVLMEITRSGRAR